MASVSLRKRSEHEEDELTVPSAGHKDRLALLLEHDQRGLPRLGPAREDRIVDVTAHVWKELAPRVVREAAQEVGVRGREEGPALDACKVGRPRVRSVDVSMQERRCPLGA